jgi:hypothetical protein
MATSNYGKDKKASGRGSRLNLSLLQTVLGWAKVGFAGKRFKVLHDKAPSQGLYLTFPDLEESPYGVVQLGDQPSVSTFDAVPAESRSARNDLIDTGGPYAFSLTEAVGAPKRWLLWNDIDCTVKLTPDLQPSCFALILGDPDEGFRVVILRGTERKELKLGATRIKEVDLILGEPLTTAEISFVEEEDDTLEVRTQSIERFPMHLNTAH